MNLNALNQAQREAVTFFEKRPLLVWAGPGTGKTRVLTERIAFLIGEKGISPGNILAITFTNLAAGEIAERIAAEFDVPPKVTTFHAWAYEIIRDVLGEKTPGLIDELDAFAIFKEGAHLLSKGTREIRRLFNEVCSLRENYPEATPEDNRIAAAYHIYKGLLYKYNVMDFDELLVRCMDLLGRDNLLKRIKEKWPHVLVDEFQDVNPIQFKIVETISTGYLTVIGDPNQSIYGFRGADPRAMDKFLSCFKDARIVRLDVAYRCHQEVLDCSSAIIAAGEGVAPSLRSQKGNGPKVVLMGFSKPKDEAKWIIDKIEAMSGAMSFETLNFGKGVQEGDSYDLSQIAILLRTRASGSEIVAGLKRRGIPYVETRGTTVSQEPTARLLARIIAIARGENVDFHTKRLQEEAGIHEGTIRECVNSLENEDLTKCLELLTTDQDDPLAGHLLRWLSSVPHPYLSSDVDFLDVNINAVHIMTIHGAKGLEFPIVFIPRCEEEILPMNGADEDEERRLLYVAMTRAEQQLYITYCLHRKSPFLKGFPNEAYIEEILRPHGKRRRKKGPKQGSLF